MNPKFDQLYELYEKYNSHTNISAIRDKDGIYEKHFSDSIKIFDHFKLNGKIIDVGTGGGFPSLAIAIADPKLEITAIDSVSKKINFVIQAIKKLELENIKALSARAEDLGHEQNYREAFDFAVSRAVAELRILLELVSAFIKPGGKFIAYKKMNNEEEIRLAKESMKRNKLKLLDQISYDKDKQFLVFEKTGCLDAKLPRTYQEIKKKPF